jgi:hypothetical protein
MTQVAKTKALHDSALGAIRSEARIGPHFKPVHFDIDAEGTATIEAEVENVAIKRLALERLAATKGVSAVVDRLRVKPAKAMSDDGILDHLRKPITTSHRSTSLPSRSAKQASSSSCAMPSKTSAARSKPRSRTA